jgi:hypothetical protein
MAAFGTSSEGEVTRHPIFGSSWTNGVWLPILKDFAGSQR